MQDGTRLRGFELTPSCTYVFLSLISIFSPTSHWECKIEPTLENLTIEQQGSHNYNLHYYGIYSQTRET